VSGARPDDAPHSLHANTILCSSGVAGLRCHLREGTCGAASLGRFCVSSGPALRLAPSSYLVGYESTQEVGDARCTSRISKDCFEAMFRATRQGGEVECISWAAFERYDSCRGSKAVGASNSHN
jgi:hypothetical protein